MSAKFHIGERVSASDTLVRQSEYTQRGPKKSWVRSGERFPGSSLDTRLPVEGVVVGLRTLSEVGISVYMGYEEGREWRAEKHREAVLIAHHLRKKPALAWAEDVAAVGGDQS